MRLYSFLIWGFLLGKTALFADQSPALSLSLAGHHFFLEVARTPEALRRGLMNRKTLPLQTGMLFLFPNPDRYCFWMKNTLVPLDLLFLDSGGSLSGMISGMQPHSLKPRCASNPVNMAIEVPSGTIKKFGLQLGMKVTGLEALYKEKEYVP